jgi:glucose/arabinose dehydrogenase
MATARCILFLLLFGAFALACGSDSSSAPIEGSTLAFDTITTGLNAPVFMTAPPGDAARLFVVEKNGTIVIIKNGSELATPFLDITAKTTKGDEQGLLGMAFAPDYATTGRFYVSYTTTGGGNAGHSVIARYQVSASNPDSADPMSEAVILTVDQPYENHNGGMITFGPDGMLYFGLGDGGLGGDPLGTGQDRTDLLGSMLRLDVSGSGYTSPPDNPFAASASFRHELWNYGLRNPWRFSFDRQTGDLYIADVGQNAYEEVDVQPASSSGGEDYGWNEMEGTHCYQSGCDRTGLTLPVLEYGHGAGCAIVGGYVYRGTAIPDVVGHYFYSDNCSGFVRSFRWTGSGITQQTSWPSLAGSGGVTSFGEDDGGELYMMTQAGGLFRFKPR